MVAGVVDIDSILIIDQQSDEPSRLLIGADQGVYVARHDPSTQKHAVSRILHLEKVAQIGTLPDSHIFVLADKTLWSFPYDILSSDHSPASSPKSPPSEVAATTLTNMQQTKRGRPVSQNTAFFHVGECLNKVMVCVVKANTLSGTIIRVLEPVASDEGKKTKSMFSLRRLVRHGPVGLKAYKDLYLPSEASSISLLKSKMCISSPREIGVVDMKNFGVQSKCCKNK